MQHEYPLRIVEEIVRAGSIRGAADFLSITPSALNRRLLRLEEELETALFERVPGGVILNAAGEVFITHARRQRADMKSVRSKIADLKGARRGRVVIVVDENVATLGSFANEIARYQTEFTGVTFRIEPTDTHKITQALTEYRADLALQLHPRPNAHVASLCATKTRINVLGRHNHPALDRDEVRLHEITQFSWSLPARGPVRKVIETAALRLGVDYQIGLECASGLAKAALQSSDIISFDIGVRDTAAHHPGLSVSTLSARDHATMFLHLSQLKGRSLSVAAGRLAEQFRKSYARLAD